MADAARGTRTGLRRAREAAFALCTLWLVIQNCVLAALIPWKRLPEMAAAITTVLKTAVLVFGPLWILGSAAILGWAFMTALAREPGGIANERDWEIDHGRAR